MGVFCLKSPIPLPLSDNTNYMSVSATDNAGGFIGYSAGSVSFYNVDSGPSTKEIKTTTESSESEAAGGLIGYHVGSTLTIENITNNISVTSYGCAGGLIGKIFNDECGITLKNIDNTGTITAYYYMGGFIGNSYAGSFVMEDCTNNGEFAGCGPSSSARCVGGFVGRLSVNGGDASTNKITGTINNTSIYLNNQGNGIWYGGIAGYAWLGTGMLISDSYTTRSISAIYESTATASRAGGLVGYMEGSNGVVTIENIDTTVVETTISVNAECAGGLIGRTYGVAVKIADCSIGNAYSSIEGKYAGGFIGYMDNSPSTSNMICDYSRNVYHIKGIVPSSDASYSNTSCIAGGLVGCIDKSYLNLGDSSYNDVYTQGDVWTAYGGTAGGAIGAVTNNSTLNSQGDIYISADVGYCNPNTTGINTYCAGGFIGRMYNSTANVLIVEYAGDIRGENYSGGLVAYALNSTISRISTSSGYLLFGARIGYDGYYDISGYGSLLGYYSRCTVTLRYIYLRGYVNLMFNWNINGAVYSQSSDITNLTSSTGRIYAGGTSISWTYLGWSPTTYQDMSPYIIDT